MEEYYVNPEKKNENQGQNVENQNRQNNAGSADVQNGTASEVPPKTYGAYYTPSDSQSGEYHFTPYIKTDINEGRGQAQYRSEASGAQSAGGNSAAVPKPAKKRSSAGRIIGITAAVMAVIITLSACAVGVMFMAKSLFPYNGTALIGSNTSETTTESANVNTETPVVNFSDGSATETNAVTTSKVAQGEKMSVEDAVAAIQNSVVEITTESVQTSRYYGSYVTSGAGSGVIISKTGMIITNNHVIEGATKITVRLTDGTEFEATLVGTDDEEDIAVISINPGTTELTAAVLGNSDSIRTGESIIVIGNPLGELGGSVSLGIISATKREIAVDEVGTMTLIQTDAAVNPGNSGGGMFNLYGELIGVVNSKYSETGVEGLGFAIPINDAWTVADDLMTYGYVKGRVIKGLKGLSVTDESEQYSLTYGACVVITAVDEGSSFQVGDIITAVNGVSVESVSDIKKALRSVSAGETVSVRVIRIYKQGFYSTSRSGTLYAEVYEVEQGGTLN